MKKSICTLTLLVVAIHAEIPKTFSYIEDKIPTIELEIRYHGENNFIGTAIDGYLAPKAILTTKATLALRQVQEELKSFNLGLKLFDAYRPQKAVDHFVRWGRDLEDTKQKAIYYPNILKKNLFREGYIAEKSGHSRGSTVDLTIIDFFGVVSHVNYEKISTQQRANRMLLNQVMLKHGFKAYAEEWWHFTLKNEPYKKTYFNFDVL